MSTGILTMTEESSSSPGVASLSSSSSSTKYVIYLVTCEEMPEGGQDDLHLLQALQSRGHDVSTVLWTDDTIHWQQADAIILRTTWDYHRRLPEFLLWAKRVESMTLLLNPLSVIEWNYSKRYLLDLSSSNRDNSGVVSDDVVDQQQVAISIIPTIITTDVDEVEKAVKEMFHYHHYHSSHSPSSTSDNDLSRSSSSVVLNDVIIKPTISGSAELTYRLSYCVESNSIKVVTRQTTTTTDDNNNVVVVVDDDDDNSTKLLDIQTIAQQILSQNAKKSEIMIQPFVSSVIHDGELSLMFIRQNHQYHFTHAVLKTVQQGDFRVQSDYGGQVQLFFDCHDSDEDQSKHTMVNKVMALAKQALQVLDQKQLTCLYVRIDIIDWKSHQHKDVPPKICEIEVIEPEMFLRFSRNNEAAILFAKGIEECIQEYRNR